jgi:integrase
MAKTKITVRALDALRSDAKRRSATAYVWDSELRGFGARVSASGQTSWLVQKWVGGRGGRAKRVVLAHYPPIDLDEARKLASIAIGDVGKGVDLVDKKSKARQAKREALNATRLGDAVEQFLRRNSTGNRYWTEVRRKFETEVISALGRDIVVREITKRDVRALVEAKLDEGKDGAARSLFAAVRPFFKWCVERDIIVESPIDGVTPPSPLQSRDRILSDDEVRAVWTVTESMPLFGPFYRLLLLTAQRREEVAAMSWSEVDLQTSAWTIPKTRTKNGKEHVVHLSAQAIQVLEAIARHEHSKLVFTTTGDTPISGYGKAKRRLDERLEAHLEGRSIEPWVVHDLRRTAASGMARLGFQPHIIERVLNHVSGVTGGLVGVYQRYEYIDDRKRALEAWGQHVGALTGAKTEKTNVVPFGAVG